MLRKHWNILSTLVLIIAVAVCFAGCFDQQSTEGSAQSLSSKQEDTFSKIKRESQMTVGFIVFPPFVIQNPNTKGLSGTFVETMEEIAGQMEVEIEWQEATWSTFIAGLQSKKFDISIAPTFSTISRAKSVAFTTPLIAAGNSAIVRKGDQRFKTLADIDKKGIVIAVTQGEQGHEYAKANFKNAEIRVLAGGDQNLTFSEVLAGRADVALGDFWIVQQFVAQQPDLHDLFADNPYNITPVAWAVRYEDRSLLTFLNTALECLDTSGKLDEINQKYDANFLRSRRVWEK